MIKQRKLVHTLDKRNYFFVSFFNIAYVLNVLFQGTGDQRIDSQGMFAFQLDIDYIKCRHRDAPHFFNCTKYEINVLHSYKL